MGGFSIRIRRRRKVIILEYDFVSHAIACDCLQIVLVCYKMWEGHWFLPDNGPLYEILPKLIDHKYCWEIPKIPFSTLQKYPVVIIKSLDQNLGSISEPHTGV